MLVTIQDAVSNARVSILKHSILAGTALVQFDLLGFRYEMFGEVVAVKIMINSIEKIARVDEPGSLDSKRGDRPSALGKPSRSPLLRGAPGARPVRRWQVLRVWGGIGNGHGALRFDPLAEPGAFSAAPAQIDKRRTQRGYVLRP